MFLFFLTFEAGHVLKVVLKFWPNLRLNVLIKFVLKKTRPSRPTMRPIFVLLGHDIVCIYNTFPNNLIRK